MRDGVKQEIMGADSTQLIYANYRRQAMASYPLRYNYGVTPRRIKQHHRIRYISLFITRTLLPLYPLLPLDHDGHYQDTKREKGRGVKDRVF
jgi:hypothetical protein